MRIPVNIYLINLVDSNSVNSNTPRKVLIVSIMQMMDPTKRK
jgi:hypothetical protein